VVKFIRGFGAAAMGDHGFDPVVTKPVAFTDGTSCKVVLDFNMVNKRKRAIKKGNRLVNFLSNLILSKCTLF